MADTRTIKQHDTWPPFVARLWEDTAKTIPVDLTEAEEVRIWLRSNSRAIATDPAEITEPEDGIIQYHFSPEETAVVGEYRVEFEVRWEPGIDEKPRVQTFPHDGYLSLSIIEELDPEE